MNVVGYVIEQAAGCYKGHLCIVGSKADIDILPDIKNTSNGQLGFRVVTEGIEIGAGWTRTGETSNKENGSLLIVAPQWNVRNFAPNLAW